MFKSSNVQVSLHGPLVAGIAGAVLLVLGLWPAPSRAEPTQVAPAAADATVTSPAAVTMLFPFVRTGDTAFPVWFHYSTANGTATAGTDYTEASGLFQIPAGAATAALAVTILGKDNNSPDKEFTLALDGIVGTGPLPNFAAKRNFGTDSAPRSVAAADLNGDGKPDLITANIGSNFGSVLVNTTAPGATTPTFAAKQGFSSLQSRAVATADINGDGKPDIITVNLNENDISVILNTTAPGSKTLHFVSYGGFSTGEEPMSVAAADLNGDGKPDLIIANLDDNNVSVLLNTTVPGSRTPSFTAKKNFAVGGSPYSVATADVNGDGRPDLITANLNGNNVSVLLNTTLPGSTTPRIASPKNFAAGANPYSVAVADVNGDGRPDLITANLNGNNVSVLLNTTAPGSGSPRFTAKNNFAAGKGPYSVAAVDVNGDGKPDLITANELGDNVSVLLNTTAPGATAPSFAAKNNFATGSNPASVAALDVNGDGKPDLITANYHGNNVSVLLNTIVTGATMPSFAAKKNFAAGNVPYSIAAADVNGDGKPDLITANYLDNDVSVLLNTTATGAATSSFAARQNFAAGNLPKSVAVADVNGDGRPDLITANNFGTNVSVLLNTTAAGAATPSFAAHQDFAAGSYPFSVAAADVNGDGHPDLIIANSGDNDVSVLLNTTAPGAATPSFAARQNFAAGSFPYSVAAADVNGDGRADLITANYLDNDVSVLLNTTATGAAVPSFAVAKNFAAGSNPYSVAVTDVNGNGRPDLIVANLASFDVSVLLNTTTLGAAAPSFAAATNFGTGSYPFSVAVADVNGDGHPDLIIANSGDNDVSVLLNTTAPGATTPSFAAKQNFAVGSKPASVGATDMNGDGRSDLITANYNGDNVSVLLDTRLAATLAPASATGTIHYDVPMPEVTLSPTPLSFGGVIAGNSNTKTETLTNTGDADLILNDISIAPSNQSDFTQSNQCPPTLAPVAATSSTTSSCTIEVTLTPTAITAYMATLEIESNASTSPDGVELQGQGTDDPPVVGDSTVSTVENTPITGKLSVTDADPGQKLSISIVTAPGQGKLKLLRSALGFTFTPKHGFTGTIHFRFRAFDGYLYSNTATVTITVTDDTAPVAHDGNATLDANITFSGQLDASDADSGQTLTYQAVTQPAHGTLQVNETTGQFTYSPVHDFTGSDDFTFKANDGTKDSNAATITLTVNAISLASSGGGGLGPWGLAALLLLALLPLLKRRGRSG